MTKKETLQAQSDQICRLISCFPTLMLVLMASIQIGEPIATKNQVFNYFCWGKSQIKMRYVSLESYIRGW